MEVNMDSQEANAYTGGYDLGVSASVVGYALLGHTWTTGQDDLVGLYANQEGY